MKNLLFITFFILTNSLLIVNIDISPPLGLPAWSGNFNDSATMRVFYALNALDINNTKTYDDIQRLDIGTKSSKCYSYFVFNNDSLKKDYLKKNPKARGVPLAPGEFGKKGYSWSLIIWSIYFKDFTKNVLTEFAFMPWPLPAQQYVEDTPVQEWQLHEDTLTVCGYLCQKATCRFRGNDFIAWFSTEIPVSNGPWKFGGLPGLILKVNDVDRHYDFECFGVESYSMKVPIIMYDERRFQKTERTKLRQLEKEIHEDYPKVSGITYTNSEGVPIPGKKFTQPYHPLELE